MTRITKIIGFSVPPVLADEVEQIAREEKRTKSELFREMLRVYRSYRKKQPEPAMDEEWLAHVIREAQEENRRNPLTQKQLLAESVRLLQYGTERAEAAGITSEEELNDTVYEERQKHRQTARRS